MKISLILYIIILVLLSIILFSGCSEDSPAEPEVSIISISGKIGNESVDITHVGLFYIDIWYDWTLPLSNNDTSPLAFAPISGKQWTLDVTNINDPDFYLLFGWNDLDGDDRYDPLSGENPAFLHLNKDTVGNYLLSNSNSNEWSLRRERPLEFFPLTLYKDSLFLFDDAMADPLASWIANDSTFLLSSGSAQLTSTGIKISFRSIITDTNNAVVQESNISVTMPSLTTRVYTGSELYSTASSSSGLDISNNLGRAGLTFVDALDQHRVRGWIALFWLNTFVEDVEVGIKAFGTFDVPIVP